MRDNHPKKLYSSRKRIKGIWLTVKTCSMQNKVQWHHHSPHIHSPHQPKENVSELRCLRQHSYKVNNIKPDWKNPSCAHDSLSLFSIFVPFSLFSMTAGKEQHGFIDLEMLPPELGITILSYLNATDLCLAGCVWQDLGNDEYLWQG